MSRIFTSNVAPQLSVHLVRSFVAIPKFKWRAMARMDWSSLNTVRTGTLLRGVSLNLRQNFTPRFRPAKSKGQLANAKFAQRQGSVAKYGKNILMFEFHAAIYSIRERGFDMSLYKLEVENFYSISNCQHIDLCARRHAGNDACLVETFPGSEVYRPNIVSFFGPNASGKTNVLRALDFLREFIGFSFLKSPVAPLNYTKFHSDSAIDAPTTIRVTLAGPSRVGDTNGESPACPYIYEVTFGPRGEQKADSILLERMTYKPQGSHRFRRIIHRTSEGKVSLSNEFELGKRDIAALEMLMRPEVSTISGLAQMGNPIAMAYVGVVQRIVANVSWNTTSTAQEEANSAKYYFNNEDALDVLNRQIQRLDLGVEKVSIVDSVGGGKAASFEHSGLSWPLPPHLESNGTRNFFSIYPIIHKVLNHGGIALLDKLDCAIHPLVLSEILNWFRDPDANPHNAQLWMNCHNVSIMEHLSRDEIFFCEKDISGRTGVYKLTDIKGQTAKDNLYKKYLGGAYGAVPNIG